MAEAEKICHAHPRVFKVEVRYVALVEVFPPPCRLRRSWAKKVGCGHRRVFHLGLDGERGSCRAAQCTVRVRGQGVAAERQDHLSQVTGPKHVPLHEPKVGDVSELAPPHLEPRNVSCIAVSPAPADAPDLIHVLPPVAARQCCTLRYLARGGHEPEHVCGVKARDVLTQWQHAGPQCGARHREWTTAAL
eukprot:scaffold111807_cov109-Phaeocystis_antarctica.AAC.2